MASVLGIVALVLGSLYGFMLAAGPGLGKLLPSHPLYKSLKMGFDTFLAPWYGVNPDLARITIGLADVAAGFGTLVALWGEQLGLLGPGGPGTLLHVAQQLILCAYIGVAFISFNAAALDMLFRDPGWIAPAVLGFVAVALLVCRLMVTHTVMFSLVGGFSAACVLMLVAWMTTRALYGTPMEEARKQHAEFKKVMEGAGDEPASTEPLTPAASTEPGAAEA